MQNAMQRRTREMTGAHLRRRRWRSVVCLLSVFAVLVTLSVLTVPAVTLEETVYCGIEEHTHTEECYETLFVCENIDEEHEHTTDCYETVLNCEIPEHTHSDDCYVTPTPEPTPEPEQTPGDEPEEPPPEESTGEGNASEPEPTEEPDPGGEAETEESVTLTAEGEDYVISVRYTAEALLPEDTALTAREILSGTEEFEYYALRAAEELGEEPGAVTRRFFDITLLSGETEVEPAAPVRVSALFAGQPDVTEDAVVHFTDNGEGFEVLTAAVDEDGLHYEQDGFSVVGFTTTDGEIDTTKTYALVYNGYALTVVDGTLTAVSTTTPPASQYVQWQFETVQGQSGYRVKTEVGNQTYYLNITRSWSPFSGVTYGIGLATTTRDTTRFTPSLNNGVNPNTVTLRGQYQNSGTQYYVTLSGSTPGVDQSTSTPFSLYYDDGNRKVATVSPSSTVINLFDYRVNLNSNASWDENGDKLDTGINAGHLFNFRNSGEGGPMNSWTGYNGGVRQGIVADRLVDGYPVLSGDATLTAGADESLKYLFDLNNLSSDDGKEFKRAYSNVKGLLQLDSNGYYFYDSTKNYAEFPVDTNTGKSSNNDHFNVYDSWAVKYQINKTGYTPTNAGEFFPFDPYEEVTQDTDAGSTALNHYFGLTLTTYFVQNYNGYSDSTHTTHTTFEFSGDDDVWIFIDDVLVADLGGIHDATGVTIDFAAGTVTIDNVYDGGNYGNNAKSAKQPQTRAFSDIFSGTDVELATYDGKTTFVNNSSHTLNFFYLERGGNSSNLSLKYNLLEIPATSIYKVNQYGETVSGAAFAVYAATTQTAEDGTVSFLYKDSNGNGVSLTGKTWDYRKSNDGGEWWDIITTDGITVPCKYYGTTDAYGEMVFQSSDGSLYSLDDLADDIIGSHNFILREVDVPDGYRTVSDESWLRIDDKAGVMLCDSTYTSGVWASNNAQVTADEKLYAASAYSDKAASMGFIKDNTGFYCYTDYMDTSGDTVSIKGTLFAVVLKRNDKTLDQLEEWYPVYGSDKMGYQVIGDDPGESNGIDAVLEAVRNQESAEVTGPGSATFTPSTLSGKVTAQLNLENLPGKIERYYTFIQEKNGGEPLTELDGNGDPQYFVAYYYTTANSVEEATAADTVRVVSRKGIVSDSYNFEIKWGTTIEVPNMQNRLFFQKRDKLLSTGSTDKDTGLVNDAVFALYPAIDAEQTGDNSGNHLSYYVGDNGETGDAKKTVYIIPYTPDMTSYERNKAAVFSDPKDETDGKSKPLGTGYYEFYTENLQFNSSTALVSSVSGEAGLMTVTMTDGSTKYYVHPAVNADGQPMVGYTHDECAASKEKGTGHFNKLLTGTYLLREISPPSGYTTNNTDIPVLVNAVGVYANAGKSDDGVSVGNGIGYLSKTLDVFASQGEIDETLTWVYGALIRSNATGFTAFDKVTHDVIRIKEDDGAATGWEFVEQQPGDYVGYGTLESQDRSDAIVSYFEYNGTLTDNKNKSSPIFDYIPNDDKTEGQAERASLPEGVTAKNFVRTQAGQTLADGTPLNRLWTMTGWSDMAIYQDYAYGVKQTSTGSTTNYDDLTGYGNISNLFSSSTFVQVTDDRVTDLEIHKVDVQNQEVALAGAEFILYRMDNGTAYYYQRPNDQTVWTTVRNDATAVTSGEGGLTERFRDLEDGTYYLYETVAPETYNVPGTPVTVVIANGAIDGAVQRTEENTNTLINTVTVTNSKTVQLPATGGVTLWYTIGGIALMALAGCLKYQTNKKYRRKNV